jgi:cell division protein FtsW
MILTQRKQILSNVRIFLGCIVALIFIGFLFIYSSSSIFALERFGSAHYFVKKQIYGLLCGLMGLLIARMVPLDFIKRWCPLLFFGSLALTACTLIPHVAHHIHGSSRWISILGFSFQPSELLKIFLLLYIAHFFAKKQMHTGSFVHSYLPFLCILSLSALVLLKQPDFGLTFTLTCTSFILLFIARFRTKHLLITLSGLIPLGLALILFKPYRLQRVLTFLDPWADPQGAGFQIIQSLIAIGSGNVWGVGIAHSKQKFFYLPMQHTDFIFSIIAEETGFIGSMALITLFAIFLLSGMRLAWQLKDPFATYAVLGFVIMTSLQSIINIAVATGLIPTKGTGLPFVSYGNTSLVCNLIMIGLIINMVHENKV